MTRRLAVLLACLAVAPLVASAEGYAPEFNAVLSRLQAMGHGSYTEQEWLDVTGQLDNLAAKAERGGNLPIVVQARAIKAMVLSDMKRDHEGALTVLDDAIREFGGRKLPEAKRLYVQKAEVYSKLGDEAAVRRTIDEFRSSPNFDPMSYPFAVGQGRDTPLSVVRPTARGADSVSVTAMEVARSRARFAPGNLFPSFTLTDSQGRAIRLQDLRGKVVLLDLWQQGWTPWRRDLAYLVSTYRRYNGYGFEIIGVALDRDVAAAQSFVAANQLPWTQVYGDTSLSRQLGIFGESANFLIDQNGMIIGQNLRSADLAHAVKQALGGGE